MLRQEPLPFLQMSLLNRLAAVEHDIAELIKATEDSHEAHPSSS
jgi:hypothetical protein